LSLIPSTYNTAAQVITTFVQKLLKAITYLGLKVWTCWYVCNI